MTTRVDDDHLDRPSNAWKGDDVQYRLLGSVCAERDGVSLDLAIRQRALLALLLIEANRVVSTDRIIDELWSDEANANHQNALWVTVSRLRGALEPERAKRTDGSILVTRPPGYVLVAEDDDIDARRFEQLAREGRTMIDTDPAAAAIVLDEALALWRGHALADFAYEPWAAPEIARLEELRLTTLEDRVEADIRAGRQRKVVSELEGLVRQHPARERLTGQLMVSLHRCGRQSDALRAFGEFRRYLADELGLDPSDAITQLEERIVLDDPVLRSATDGPGRPGSGSETGLSVRGYELRDRIGTGAIGSVFTAFQPAMGREVAIKVVHADHANDPDFIRRFEADARLVASLEHPRIVPVYDYWREPDVAYLVMRRLDGGSLRDLIERGNVPLDVTQSVIEQVGGALAAAHDKGIAHGDIRPSHVLIDAKGDTYVSDFGLTTGPDDSLIADEFTAPERLETGAASAAADQYALGMVARRLLADVDADRSVGQAVIDVVEHACASHPDGRFADVRSFVVAFQDAMGDAARSSDLVVSNPYRGLRAFHEPDANVFFGRERLVERLIGRLGATGTTGRFVALVGPSGSGKSSVVRAGLVPALRREAVPGSHRWFVAVFTPGRNPFTALAEALQTVAVAPPTDLPTRLRVDGIAPTVRSLVADGTTQTLIIVDQLEELFAQTRPDDADDFMVALADAATDRHSAVKFVATLRADFYDHPLRHPSFGEVVRLGTEVITPMNASELGRAVTGPAAVAGVTVDPGVVASIAADMAGQSTALPLMQFALTELFDRRSGPNISTDDYRELGGLATALALRADAVLAGLLPARQADVRNVFLRLVTLIDDSADTRRRATLNELKAATHGDIEPVLDAFATHRLVSFDRDPITRVPTVEIAHEALLTEWSTLRDWIAVARSDVRLQRRLATSADEWRQRLRSPDYLLSGDRLTAYRGWLDGGPVQLTAAELEFLIASHDHSEAEIVTERRRVRRLRRLVGVTGLAFAVAAAAAGVAAVQQTRAADARDLAETRRAVADEAADLAEEQRGIAEAQTAVAEASALTADLERMRAQATAEVGTNPPLAALLAVEAYNIDESHLSAGAIQQVLTGVDGRQATLFDTVADYGGRNVISDDKSVVAAGGAEFVDVWDVDERSLRLRVDALFADFDLSADASLLAVSPSRENRVELIDPDSGGVLGEIERQVCYAVRISPTGDRLALVTSANAELFGCDDDAARAVEIWNIADPSRPSLEHAHDTANDWEVWWTPDGGGYVTASPTGSVTLHDAATHQPTWTHQFDLSSGVTRGDFARPIGALYATDGREVVVGTQFNDVSGILLFTFDVATGEVTRDPTSTAGLGSMNWWNEDETQIVGTLWPSGATVLDLELAIEVLPTPIVNPNATSVWIDRPHERVVVSSFVGVEVFSLDGTSVLERRVGLTPDQLAAKDLSDGQVFGSMTSDGTRLLVTLFDTVNGPPAAEWDLTTDPPTLVTERPPSFAFAQGESTLLFDLEGLQVLDGDHRAIGPKISIEPERGQPYLWRASADGSRHAPLRAGSVVIDVYDGATGERVTELASPGGGDPNGVFLTDIYSLSADGRYLIATFVDDDGAAWSVFDTSTGEAVHTRSTDSVGLPWLAGTTIYSNPPDRFDLERLDVETLEPVGPPLVGHTLILNAIEDDLDSGRIVTQATNGNVRVWDRETGDQIGREIAIGRQSSGTGIALARDGDLVGVILDREFAIWNYDIETWPVLACDIAGRNMTQSEWDDFGPQGADYRTTCPQYPPGN